MATIAPGTRHQSTPTLAAGQRLTCYEIRGLLGAGGMGEVYRAHDTRLERDVAIKVLPRALVDDENHLALFEREAKHLAALNHPNVASIYALDRADGVHFLVLELVPGESLRTRVARGPLPIAEATAIARQVARGLQAAHEAGIVHRDIKPANVVVTPNGHAKILDFGLAHRGPVPATVESFAVLGTPAYLSPEQVRGEPSDRRADVWSFGCLLYECLTAKRAFPGETLGENMESILDSNPDLGELPTPLRRLVAHCLAHDPADRLQDMGAVGALLRGVVARGAG